MRPLTCLIAAGMLAVATPPALAQTVAYGEAFDTLYRVDLDTRVATRVGGVRRTQVDEDDGGRGRVAVPERGLGEIARHGEAGRCAGGTPQGAGGVAAADLTVLA